MFKNKQTNKQTGDHCYPLNASYPKRYSARVVKRSTDAGASWGPMTEIARSGIGKHLLPGHGGEHPSHVGYVRSQAICSCLHVNAICRSFPRELLVIAGQRLAGRHRDLLAEAAVGPDDVSAR